MSETDEIRISISTELRNQLAELNAEVEVAMRRLGIARQRLDTAVKAASLALCVDPTAKSIGWIDEPPQLRFAPAPVPPES